MHICKGPAASCVPVRPCRVFLRSGSRTTANVTSLGTRTGLPVRVQNVANQLDRLGMESPFSGERSSWQLVGLSGWASPEYEWREATSDASDSRGGGGGLLKQAAQLVAERKRSDGPLRVCHHCNPQTSRATACSRPRLSAARTRTRSRRRQQLRPFVEVTEPGRNSEMSIHRRRWLIHEPPPQRAAPGTWGSDRDHSPSARQRPHPETHGWHVVWSKDPNSSL